MHVQLTDIELVFGYHHISSDFKVTAFTKWCPTTKRPDTLQQTKDAVDLAFRRMGQKQVAILQCWSSTHLSSFANAKSTQTTAGTTATRLFSTTCTTCVLFKKKAMSA